eukprot:g46260.t1
MRPIRGSSPRRKTACSEMVISDKLFLVSALAVSSLLYLYVQLPGRTLFNAVTSQSYDSVMSANYRQLLSALNGRKFYMYDEPAISMQGFLEKLPDLHAAHQTPDDMLVTMFKHHPLRTLDPKQADFFIIPILMEYHMKVGWENEGSQQFRPWLEAAFESLVNHPVFRTHQGNRHFLAIHDWMCWHLNLYPGSVLAMYLPYMENVTFGVSSIRDKVNPNMTNQMVIPYPTIKQQWDTPYAKENHGHFLTHDSLEAWSQRPYHLFYHTRISQSRHGATVLRQFFNDTILQKFYHTKSHYKKKPVPVMSAEFAKRWKVSMGFDMPPDEFVDTITKSKFCLVIRGDDPSSHSFARALAAQCIPIFISDQFDDVALPFYPHLSSHPFTYRIPEANFLEHPWNALDQVLQSANDSTHGLRAKFLEMMEARRSQLYIHPSTLVPDFVLLSILDPRHGERFKPIYFE